MLTRRAFTMLGTALMSAIACRPSWGARAFAIDTDGPVSARLVALGDAWEVAGRAYEVRREAAFHLAGDAPELVAVKDAARVMLAAANDVFLEPSRTRADVLLKYHVMDKLVSLRVVHDSDAIIAAGGAQWHRIVEQEAETFSLDLNYFWLWEAPPHAKSTVSGILPSGRLSPVGGRCDMRHRKDVTRREALLLVSGGAAAAAMPVMVMSPANAAAIPKPHVHIRYSLSLRTTLRLLREHNGKAGKYYLATGDHEPIIDVRRIAQDRFGFYLGLDAKDEAERLLFLEADALLDRLTSEFPQVPWDTGQRERFAKLRRWAQAGGQGGTAYESLRCQQPDRIYCRKET